MKVNLLIVATNKYISFLPGLITSAEKYFLKDCNCTAVYHIFTDKPDKCPAADNIKTHCIVHKPFPYTTLFRYHFFSAHEAELQDADYLFYIDADTLFTAPITNEIISDRAAVQHCGFVNTRGSYETDQRSTSYVGPNEGTHYFGGGFWGFSKPEFWNFIDNAMEMIDSDINDGITPIHNDESVLNRYLIDNPPTLILSPSYHYPESELAYYKKIWGQDYGCKILLLDKNHEEIRK